MSSIATKAPVFFISHGAPTFAIEPGVLGPRLQALGQQLKGIRAVLVVSPHWQTRGVRVMTTEKPETVYDFGGFPSILYTLEYPAPGHPALAQHAADLLQAAGWDTATVSAQGLDHGAWVPLLHLLPDAQIPVFQVSMPLDLTTVSALALGRALAPLREQGVLIVASGSMTHNLHEFRQRATVAEPYVLEFSNWVNAAVKANSITAMTRYRSEAPHAQRAHPSEEHFLPLLVALGAQEGGNGSGSGSGDVLQAIDGGVTHGMLSMDSFVWGMPG